MMSLNAQSAYTLINPNTKTLVFELFEFDDDRYFREPRKHNYYTIIMVNEAKGEVISDFSKYQVETNALMAFTVYQPFAIHAEKLKGVLIHFHPDFFCIHKHPEEVGCNGVLFNNIYTSPIAQLSNDEMDRLTSIIDSLKREIRQPAMAQYELMLSYLKIFLIQASRYKIGGDVKSHDDLRDEPFILKTLKDAIEEHYRTKHRASDYADLLSISVRALNKLTTTYFNRTLTNLIVERIIIEAKRELYLTSKPVKAIASELGFKDEFYFSRFFKINSQVSPNTYRTTVGFARQDTLVRSL